MIDKNTIINELHRVLEPLPFIRAFWLEGADAAGYADEYSDFESWVDCEDAQEEEAIAVVEDALARLSPIDYRYICHHSHPKIRQRIYHLAGTGEYLMIDFCWQLHSRTVPWILQTMWRETGYAFRRPATAGVSIAGSSNTSAADSIRRPTLITTVMCWSRSSTCSA